MGNDILLLDNKDSFVWNLAQAFGVLGRTVDVVRSDRITVDEIERRAPAALVLSPGPGRPAAAGVCVAATRALSGQLPILGVCLGHQAIAAAFGGGLERSPPCHGKAWTIRHRGTGLFAGLPDPLHGCRYHSLSVPPAGLPDALVAEAWTPEGQIMALRHVRHATYGLQFHPESFRTSRGLDLLAGFLEAAA